jgi:hypothetical protein
MMLIRLGQAAGDDNVNCIELPIGLTAVSDSAAFLMSR